MNIVSKTFRKRNNIEGIQFVNIIFSDFIALMSIFGCVPMRHTPEDAMSQTTPISEGKLLMFHVHLPG